MIHTIAMVEDASASDQLDGNSRLAKVAPVLYLPFPPLVFRKRRPTVDGAMFDPADGVICPGVRHVVNGFFLLRPSECFRLCLTNFTAVKPVAISEHNIHWIPQQATRHVCPIVGVQSRRYPRIINM
jgi:hypothetical protein